MKDAETAYAVAIVVDPEFGDRLTTLAANQHVWAVKSPSNEQAAEKLRGNDGKDSLEKGVTLFAPTVGDSPTQWCADMIGTVEEHHGKYSHIPPVTVLDIYGAKPTPLLRNVLADYGFTDIAETSNGFQARACSAI
jgi:hypothetical protein